MEKVTQGNAASAQQTAAAAAELTSQSSTVRAIVGHLTGMVGQARAEGVIEGILADQQRTSWRQGPSATPPRSLTAFVMPSHAARERDPMLAQLASSDF